MLLPIVSLSQPTPRRPLVKSLWLLWKVECTRHSNLTALKSITFNENVFCRFNKLLLQRCSMSTRWHTDRWVEIKSHLKPYVAIDLCRRSKKSNFFTDLCYQLKYPDYKYNMCNIYSDDEFSLVVERVIRLWIEADMNLSSIDVYGNTYVHILLKKGSAVWTCETTKRVWLCNRKRDLPNHLAEHLHEACAFQLRKALQACRNETFWNFKKTRQTDEFNYDIFVIPAFINLPLDRHRNRFIG